MLLVVFLFSALVLPSKPEANKTVQIGMQSDAARDLTRSIIKDVRKKKWSAAEDKIKITNDPLAIKLYDWLIFTQGSGKNWDSSKFINLAQFIRQNTNWPQARTLRSLAEDIMPASLPSSEVIAWYDDYKPQTSTGLDQYLRALIATGQTPRAKQILAKWWMKTLTSREDQRVIYRKYKKLITREAHIRRLDVLLYAGHYSNAGAIAGVLGSGYPELARARIALAGNRKSNVGYLINKVPEGLRSDPGLLYERLRWRRRNDLDFRAMEILHTPPPLEKVHNPKDWWQERHIIIRRLLEDKKYDSAYLLATGHIQKYGFAYVQAEWITGWLALRFMDKPEEALKKFEGLYGFVKTPISKTRAAYWAGRASKQLGHDDMAAEWYRKASKHQTAYYGQIAGSELALNGELPKVAPPILTGVDKDNFEKHELMQVARLFHSVGDRKSTSRFMQALVAEVGTPKVYSYVAQEAAKIDQYHDAIRISKKATQKGMFLTAQSYPIITNNLKNVDVEWAILHSLIRQESMFDYKAKSPVGALGLMQLMPSTAKEVARKVHVKHRTSWLTSRPNHNIHLGSQYLKQMLEKFDGSYPLAIAAYNAGPGRVQGWIRKFGDPRSSSVDMIDWIEMIPIYETRNYVQRVMEGVYVYRLRLKNRQPAVDYSLYAAMTRSR